MGVVELAPPSMRRLETSIAKETEGISRGIVVSRPRLDQLVGVVECKFILQRFCAVLGWKNPSVRHANIAKMSTMFEAQRIVIVQSKKQALHNLLAIHLRWDALKSRLKS